MLQHCENKQLNQETSFRERDAEMRNSYIFEINKRSVFASVYSPFEVNVQESGQLRETQSSVKDICHECNFVESAEMK